VIRALMNLIMIAQQFQTIAFFCLLILTSAAQVKLLPAFEL
jgi:hypothetical protein